MFKHMEQVTRGDGGRGTGGGGHNLNDCTLISRIRYVDISEILIMLSLFNSRMFSMLSGTTDFQPRLQEPRRIQDLSSRIHDRNRPQDPTWSTKVPGP